ncbi:hypothetical protein GGI07_001977 [Coemansia sp. Benny D115]|nr:hypothetical protein GGI07_001977 [Coemansia sp. Benny D115]
MCNAILDRRPSSTKRQQALFSFLNQYRDIGSLDLVDLPASLQSQAELQQLNEGVLQLLPDLSDVSGRALLIDQLVQQLDSSNPSKLDEILTVGNLQSTGPTTDPLLSAVSNGSGVYHKLSPPGSLPMSQPLSSTLAFDLTASPEVSVLSASSLPLGSQLAYPQRTAAGTTSTNIVSYPPQVPVSNPTLTDLVTSQVATSSPMALIEKTLRVSSSPQRIPSLSPAVPTLPDPVMNARPIARPRGTTTGPMQQLPYAARPQVHQGGPPLYNSIYTPLQLQQAQQAQYAASQQRAYAQAAMMGATVPGAPYGVQQQKQRAPVPNAQVVDPAAHQAQMNALMMYRAMGLQCKAPDAADDDDEANEEDPANELSLDDWLDSERLTEQEVAGGISLSATTAADIEQPLPTPAATPAASASLDEPEPEPELEDSENHDEAYQMRHPSVKNSILVQRSFAKQPTASASSVPSEEPVSYMRQRKALLAKTAAASAVSTDDHTHDDRDAPASAKSAEEAEREDLVRVAVQLLARINTLYHRKVEAERSQQLPHVQAPEPAALHTQDSADSDADADDDLDDLDDLERELNAMSLENGSSKQMAGPGLAKDAPADVGAQQDIIERMAKLGLSSDNNKVCV